MISPIKILHSLSILWLHNCRKSSGILCHRPGTTLYGLRLSSCCPSRLLGAIPRPLCSRVHDLYCASGSPRCFRRLRANERLLRDHCSRCHSDHEVRLSMSPVVGDCRCGLATQDNTTSSYLFSTCGDTTEGPRAHISYGLKRPLGMEGGRYGQVGLEYESASAWCGFESLALIAYTCQVVGSPV